MKKILFVCLGNICRSPGAEAIMKAWIKKEGKEKEFLIDSAGLYSGHAGALPDERMRRHASRRGYVLDSRARTFYPTADFAEFDMIIGMDDQNIEALKRAAINEPYPCRPAYVCGKGKTSHVQQFKQLIHWKWSGKIISLDHIYTSAA